MQEISLMGRLERKRDDAKGLHSIYKNDQEKSMYFLGLMDGIEAAIKELVAEAGA